MGALTPARCGVSSLTAMNTAPNSGQVSPLHACCLPAIPSPTTPWTPRIALTPCTQRARRVPGFAIHSQARRSNTPNRVRHPTDWPFAFRCFPPRLAATQLRSATVLQGGTEEDFHLSNNMRSRAHECGGSPPLYRSQLAGGLRATSVVSSRESQAGPRVQRIATNNTVEPYRRTGGKPPPRRRQQAARTPRRAPRAERPNRIHPLWLWPCREGYTVRHRLAEPLVPIGRRWGGLG